MHTEKKTSELSNTLNNIKSKSDFEKYLSNNTSVSLSFQNYYETILNQKGLRLSDIATRCACAISKSYIYNIFDKSRNNPSRNIIICLCIAANMSLDETQRALEITNAGILYPKNTGDAIIINSINNGIYSLMEINDNLIQHNIKDVLIRNIK